MESKETVIGTIPRNDSEAVIVRVLESEKFTSIDVRQHYKPDGSNDWKPTKKGIRFNATEFGSWIQTMRKLEKTLNEMKH